jgi:hypothetical protein
MATKLDENLPSDTNTFLADFAALLRACAAKVNEIIDEIANIEVDPPSSMNDTDIVFTDNTTGNVSTAKHGYAPKGDDNLTHYLNGKGAYAQVADTHLATDDNTINNVSTAKHGFCPKLSGDGADVFRGDGTFGSPLTYRYTESTNGVAGAGTAHVQVINPNLVVNDMFLVQCTCKISGITDPGTLRLSLENVGTAIVVFGHANEDVGETLYVTTAMNDKRFSLFAMGKCTEGGSFTPRFTVTGPAGTTISELDICAVRV